MQKPKNKPKAFIFDVFGTLVDWRTGVATVAQKAFKEKSITYDPFKFAELWRDEYKPAMERIRSGKRGYISLDILHRENLERVLEKTGLSNHFTSTERDTLNHAWEQLPPWSDVPDNLSKLRKHGFIAPCSNGSIALMMRLARFANLPWDAILGAEIAKNYKPELQVYKAACQASGLSPEDVMMVAAHNDDLFAAREAGLQTGFFPRKTEHGPNQTIDLEAESDWEFCGKDMHSLLTFLEQY